MLGIAWGYEVPDGLKGFHVIELTSPYDTEASQGKIYAFFVVKLPTQSELGQVCMGKGDVPLLAT